MTQPLVIETTATTDVTREDGGRAFILDVYCDSSPVRASLVSYHYDGDVIDYEKGHQRIREFVGKRVRVTIEVID